MSETSQPVMQADHTKINLGLIEATEVTPSAPLPNHGEGVRAIVELAQKAAGVTIANINLEGNLGNGLPSSVPISIDLRQGGKIESLKPVIESYRTRPERKKGTAHTTTLQSFIDLTNRHKDEHTAIFAQTRLEKHTLENCTAARPALQAVLNYHEKQGATARHGDHRITYEFPVTEEFKVWLENDGAPMEQSEFARFLEDHSAELASPFVDENTRLQDLFKERVATPTEVVALSRNLEIYVGQSIKRAERLQSGERTVEFVESHSNAKGEKVDIPGIFIISVPVFQDGEPVRIPARLRYRVKAGSIIWFYQLYRWQDEVHNRIKDDMTTVAKETALPVYEGSPETC